MGQTAETPKVSSGNGKPSVQPRVGKTNKIMGVVTMNAVHRRIVKPDLPSCALATATGQIRHPKGSMWEETRLFFDSREGEFRIITGTDTWY